VGTANSVNFVNFKQHSFISRKLLYLFIPLLLAAALLTNISSRAEAAGNTCSWTGNGGDNNWSTAANWDGCLGAAPTDADNLFFPPSPARTTSTNDLVGLDLDSIYIEASDMIFNGNDIDLTPTVDHALILNGDDNDWAISITINGSDNRQIFSAFDNIISGDIELNITGAGNFFIGHNNSSSSLEISGDISGSVANNLYTSNSGYRVIYSGNNTFTANIFSGGEVTCKSNTCFGNVANTLDIYGNAVTFEDVTFANPINVSSGGSGIYSDGDVTLTGNIELAAPVFTIYAYEDSTLSIESDIDTNTYSMFFMGPGTHTQDGVISGSGEIFVYADTTFSGNNTFTGNVEISAENTLTVNSANGLGTTDGDTTISFGATLVAGTGFGSLTIPENISVSGTGVSDGGAIRKTQSNASATVLSGTITLNYNTYIYVGGNTEVGFSGQITGTGNITFGSGAETGRVSFSGSVSNDYVGETNLESLSSLSLGKTGGAIAVPGDIYVHGDTGPSVLILSGDDQIADDTLVTLDAENYEANIYAPIEISQTFGMISGDGKIRLTSDATELRVGSDDSDGVFSGIIQAGGSTITKVGTGKWTLTGTVAPEFGEFANFVVEDGELNTNFADTSGGFSPITLDGGNLSGTGNVGQLSINEGDVSPGNSPGCLNPTGNVTMAASPSSLIVDIEGSTPCSGYDVFAASGNVDLNGARLELNTDPSFTPTPGTVFEIVGGNTVTGTFEGLPNNSNVTIGNYIYRINYTSNRVTLTFGEASDVVGTPPKESLPRTGIAIGASILTAMLLLGAGLALRKHRRPKPFTP